MKDIDVLEVIGSGWRMPRVQAELVEYLTIKEKDREGKEPLYLGQHLNGDEAPVMGASLFAANATRAIRPVKRVFFADTHSHNYTMDIVDLETGEQIKNTTSIAGPDSKLGLKKKITVGDSQKDFAI